MSFIKNYKAKKRLLIAMIVIFIIALFLNFYLIFKLFISSES